MRFLLASTLILVLLSSVRLITERNGSALLSASWNQAAQVLPNHKMHAVAANTKLYTVLALQSFLPELQRKLHGEVRSSIELVVFRGLVAWHMVPALMFPVVIGLLEGTHARRKERAVVKIHSPMRFNASLLVLALLPAVVVLWLTAPVALPPVVLALLVFVTCAWAFCNIVVHAPRQF